MLKTALLKFLTPSCLISWETYALKTSFYIEIFLTKLETYYGLTESNKVKSQNKLDMVQFSPKIWGIRKYYIISPGDKLQGQKHQNKNNDGSGKY